MPLLLPRDRGGERNCVKAQLHSHMKDDVTSVFSRFRLGQQRGSCDAVTEVTTRGEGHPPTPSPWPRDA